MMNERIQEFAHKAEFINKKHNGDEWRWGYIDPELSAKLEKFAELIVRECLSYAKDGDLDFMKFMIKKNFGVEE